MFQFRIISIRIRAKKVRLCTLPTKKIAITNIKLTWKSVFILCFRYFFCIHGIVVCYNFIWRFFSWLCHFGNRFGFVKRYTLQAHPFNGKVLQTLWKTKKNTNKTVTTAEQSGGKKYHQKSLISIYTTLFNIIHTIRYGTSIHCWYSMSVCVCVYLCWIVVFV